MVLRIQRYARIVAACLWIVIALLVTIGCVSYPRPYPWNFPEAREWNQPLEFSWVNAYDNYNKIVGNKKPSVFVTPERERNPDDQDRGSLIEEAQ
jgi:hypothetical protein